MILINTDLRESGLCACICSRITTVIHVVREVRCAVGARNLDECEKIVDPGVRDQTVRLPNTSSYQGHASGYEAVLGALNTVTLSLETPITAYSVSYRRAYGLSTSGLFQKSV